MDHLVSALLRAQNVYVIGRGAGLGAAQEVALKLKECCSLHAEAYSASEVLHGVMKPLTVLMLDTEDAATQDSMDRVEARFQEVGGEVYRLKPSDFDVPKLTPAASAAILIYPDHSRSRDRAWIQPRPARDLSKSNGNSVNGYRSEK